MGGSIDSNQLITVLGAGGWIGSSLVAHLQSLGHSVQGIDRSRLGRWLQDTDSPGLLICAIGLTADFRQRPYATVDAHVNLISQILQRPGIDQFLLISSTRVYARSSDTTESEPLQCLSSDPSDLYNLSKLLGESLVLQDPRPGMKVVRVSNVVGDGQPTNTFLGALLEQARNNATVTILQPSHTSKNYVALEDVIRLLPLIAERGQKRLYNLGSVHNTTHAEVAAWLSRQGIDVHFAMGEECSPGLSFPPLAIDRLVTEFGPPGDPFRKSSYVPSFSIR